MAKISVVMIVKNEEAMLARCLESVKEADEIIVCDTGSTDTTVEIAKRFTDKVYTDFTWCDDFSKARNHAKEKATGDWILSIDADEFLHDFSRVREAVEREGVMWNVKLIGETDGQIHLFPRLFKNIPAIQWEGAVHNRLNTIPNGVCDVEITYGQSPAHLQDPNRAIRILENEVKTKGQPREMYYLGKEYMHRGRYSEAIVMLTEYLRRSVFLAEMADANLLISQCYWQIGVPDKAHDACLQAIRINAHFKEAILWMGAMSSEANAQQWHAMAQTADNREVLFVRVK